MVGVIESEAFAYLAGLHPDSGVIARVVARRAPEDLDANGAFLENVGVAVESVLHHKSQEVLAAFARAEFMAGQDAGQLLAYLLFGWPGAAFPIWRPWSRASGLETSEDFLNSNKARRRFRQRRRRNRPTARSTTRSMLYRTGRNPAQPFGTGPAAAKARLSIFVGPMSQMLEETRQQPEALARTLRDGLATLRDLRREFEARPPRLVTLVARGTSDNAAQFGRYLIEITTRVPVSLAAPSVLTLYQCPLDLSGTLVVGISQSGESTDTNAVLEDARLRGAVTVGITNQSDSAMARVAEFVIAVRAGSEQSVAATKTYTCQLLGLYLLAAALGGQVDLEILRRLPDWVLAVLELEERTGEIAER